MRSPQPPNPCTWPPELTLVNVNIYCIASSWSLNVSFPFLFYLKPVHPQRKLLPDHFSLSLKTHISFKVHALGWHPSKPFPLSTLFQGVWQRSRPSSLGQPSHRPPPCTHPRSTLNSVPIPSLTCNHPVPTLPQLPTPAHVNSCHNHVLLYSSQMFKNLILQSPATDSLIHTL